MGNLLLGALSVLGLLGPLAVGARRARRRWFGVTGATARLIEAVLILAQIYLVAYALGAVGWFRRGPMVAACVVVGLALALAAGRGSVEEPQPDRGLSRSGRVQMLMALAAGVTVFGQYLAHSLVSARRGIYDDDTVWYHAPVAAKFVQYGWTTHVYFEGGERLVTYYPYNAELAAAVTALPFHRGTFFPVLNLGWLVLALLAGWCFGQRYQRGPIGLAVTAVALSLPIMATREAGTLGNDLPGVALLLSAAALLVHGRWQPPWLVLSGIAAGLSAGVKLSLLPPVAGLAVGVLVAAPRRRRRHVLCTWVGAAAVAAGYWPVRDWVVTGNPLPWLSLHLGPLRLRALPDPGSTFRDTSVLHYAVQAGSWGRIFSPGLWIAFGPAWPVVLALAAGAGLAALVYGRDRPSRAVAAAGLVGVVIYTGLPDTVFSPALGRFTFADTSRYAVPSMILVLVGLSASRAVRREAVAAVSTGISLALVVTAQFPRVYQGFSSEWSLPSRDVILGFGVSAAVLVVALALREARRDYIWLATPVVAALAFIWPFSSAASAQYSPTSRGSGTVSVFSWGGEVRHARIGVAGSFAEYPFYGADLSNSVQYVSVRGRHGTFINPTTCASWLAAVNEGHYDYLVLFPPSSISGVQGWPEQGWLESTTGAVLVRRYTDGEVWRLVGPLAPDVCAH